MKITKNVLREMIEAELLLLNEANEKEALRAYFSINDQIKLGQGDRGDIVTALQDFLIEKSNEESLSAVDSIKSAVEAMGEPDGNIGPKTVAAINAFQGHFELEETGVYNSAVHDAIAGPAPAVEAAEEEAAEEESTEDAEASKEEESADFPHPKWDALLEELSPGDTRDLKNLTSEEATQFAEDVIKTFRSKLIEFVNSFESGWGGPMSTLTRDMKRSIVNKLSPKSNPTVWTTIENIEDEFSSLVDEKEEDEDFDVFDGGANIGRLIQGKNEKIKDLNEEFERIFISADDDELTPLVRAGDFLEISGTDKLKAAYLGVVEIIEKWDVVTRAEEVEETEEPTQLSESRFQKLAGI